MITYNTITIISPSNIGECSEYIEYLKEYVIPEGVTIEFINFSSAANLKSSLKDNIDKKVESIYLGLLTGGADVSPEKYGEKAHPTTQINRLRDELETNFIYTITNMYGYPILGICRGAQLLTVENGGKLVQNIDGHFGSHRMVVPDFKVGIEITSDHHQMMLPYNLYEDKYKLLAWSENNLSATYENGKQEQIKMPANWVEPEIIYFPYSRSLAIQGHPEYGYCPTESKRVIGRLIRKYLNL